MRPHLLLALCPASLSLKPVLSLLLLAGVYFDRLRRRAAYRRATEAQQKLRKFLLPIHHKIRL